ncbi:MAG TPA: preprotein translocase subunit SecG [Firmicutes bacterium]|nr:preprotein translocase subunit SecG [Bacillota bacterium]
MLFNVLIIVHILICLALIGAVLAQTGKGGSLSSMFGGGGGEMFLGATGASKLFARLTTGLAVVFMVLCFILAIMSTKQYETSGIPQVKPPASEVPTIPGPAPEKPSTVPVGEETETVPPIEHEQPSPGPDGNN